MVKSHLKFPNRGGSKKIKNFPSSKISQVREGGLRTWEQFPSYTLWLITRASLTLDTYLIDTSRDGIIEEFPVLSAETSVSTPHALLCQQSEAQKSATRLQRDKFSYLGKDPLPNEFQDKRNEIEKIESILRTTSQILDKDQLDIWNSICERDLHLVRQHNSGIPLLKSDITRTN